MLMPVHVGAQPLLGVVQVETDDPVKADEPVKFGEGSVIAGRCAEFVAGGYCMAGIEADGETVGESAFLDDGLQVFEAEAEVGSLAGGILEKDFPGELRGRGEEFVERVDDPPYSGLLTFSEM